MGKISMRAARVNAGLTALEIAKKMHISERTIGMWETGKRVPKYASLTMYAEICGTTTDDIFLPNSLGETEK